MRSSFLTERLRRFRRDRRGNVAMIFALSAPVLVFAVAVAVDYTNATIAQSKLNAAADAAALAALTPAMLQQSNGNATAAATAMFNARASAIASLVPGKTIPIVSVTNSPNNPAIRIVTVSYTAENNTIFGGTLNLPYMDIAGTSTSQASVPPNINFYLLLDNSPSMQLPAYGPNSSPNPDGLNAMLKLTPTQDGGNGCAFACHQASTNNTDTMGNPCSDGSSPTLPYNYKDSSGNPASIANQFCAPTNPQTGQVITQIDNYALAKQNNITLKLDELSAGVTTLLQTAYKYQTSGYWASPPTYQFAAYSMDTPWQVSVNPQTKAPGNDPLMAMTYNYVGAWAAAAPNFVVMEMYANNSFCTDQSCNSGTLPGATPPDTATDFDVAMSDINAAIVNNPGNGTNLPGDKPQEVVFFVSDGVEDEATASCSQPLASSGTRCQSPIDPALCAAIKSRNIKIAILYTQYLQVPNNNWYSAWVAPFQPDIASQMQACASPGLFLQAQIGDDLGHDLATLFQLVTQSAALTN